MKVEHENMPATLKADYLIAFMSPCHVPRITVFAAVVVEVYNMLKQDEEMGGKNERKERKEKKMLEGCKGID